MTTYGGLAFVAFIAVSGCTVLTETGHTEARDGTAGASSETTAESGRLPMTAAQLVGESFQISFESDDPSTLPDPGTPPPWAFHFTVDGMVDASLQVSAVSAYGQRSTFLLDPAGEGRFTLSPSTGSVADYPSSTGNPVVVLASNQNVVSDVQLSACTGIIALENPTSFTFLRDEASGQPLVTAEATYGQLACNTSDYISSGPRGTGIGTGTRDADAPSFSRPNYFDESYHLVNPLLPGPVFTTETVVGQPVAAWTDSATAETYPFALSEDGKFFPARILPLGATGTLSARLEDGYGHAQQASIEYRTVADPGVLSPLDFESSTAIVGAPTEYWNETYCALPPITGTRSLTLSGSSLLHLLRPAGATALMVDARQFQWSFGGQVEVRVGVVGTESSQSILFDDSSLAPLGDCEVTPVVTLRFPLADGGADVLMLVSSPQYSFSMGGYHAGLQLDNVRFE